MREQRGMEPSGANQPRIPEVPLGPVHTLEGRDNPSRHDRTGSLLEGLPGAASHGYSHDGIDARTTGSKVTNMTHRTTSTTNT